MVEDIQLSESVKQDMQEAVDRGATRLDQVNPTWYLQLDLGKLEMNRCDTCVVGQLMLGYQPETVLGLERNWTLLYYTDVLTGERFDLVPGADDARDSYWGFDLTNRWLTYDEFESPTEAYEEENLLWRYLEELWTREVKDRFEHRTLDV